MFTGFFVDNDLRKYLGVLLVMLEVILASCLVFLSFIFAFWLEPGLNSGAEISGWIKESIKRMVIIGASGVLAAWALHRMNLHWIKNTGMGTRKNSLIFSMILFILVFLAGLTGSVFFVLYRPLA